MARELPARGTAVEPRSRSERMPSRRTTLLFLAGGAFLAVGVGLLIAKAARFAEVLDELKDADAAWAPVLLAGEVLAFVGYGIAYRGTARVNGGPQFSFTLTMRLVATSQAGVAVGMGIGGLAVDYWALRRAGEEQNVAVSRVLALNTLEWAVLGAAAAAAAGFELVGIGEARRGSSRSPGSCSCRSATSARRSSPSRAASNGSPGRKAAARSGRCSRPRSPVS